mmetsp:Transcript_5786/g.14964  ORF Transcript_5786/g.14964 Transcript_5786/m.14964 type:complete len:211 (+) Transcript_5786:139-771(+)
MQRRPGESACRTTPTRCALPGTSCAAPQRRTEPCGRTCWPCLPAASGATPGMQRSQSEKNLVPATGAAQALWQIRSTRIGCARRSAESEGRRGRRGRASAESWAGRANRSRTRLRGSAGMTASGPWPGSDGACWPSGTRPRSGPEKRRSQMWRQQRWRRPQRSSWRRQGRRRPSTSSAGQRLQQVPSQTAARQRRERANDAAAAPRRDGS